MSERDLEEEMMECDIIRDKVLDNEYAKKLYAAMCNIRWHADGEPEPWSCTWRASGRIVARLRGSKAENYMSWYLSSREGIVDPEIEEDLGALGWRKLAWPKEGYFPLQRSETM